MLPPCLPAQNGPHDEEELLCATNQEADIVVAVFHNPCLTAPGSSGSPDTDTAKAERFLRRCADAFFAKYAHLASAMSAAQLKRVAEVGNMKTLEPFESFERAMVAALARSYARRAPAAVPASAGHTAAAPPASSSSVGATSAAVLRTAGPVP